MTRSVRTRARHVTSLASRGRICLSLLSSRRGKSLKDQQEEWQILCACAAVERDPAQLLKLVRRINELLQLKRARLEGRVFLTASRRKHIFQIAYDELLLISRAQILKDRGYDVTSVLGNADAQRILAKREKYHIFLIGHAAPHSERQAMAGWIKCQFPGAKVLALNAPTYGALPEADFNFVLNGPEEWLAAIAREAA